MFVMTQSILNRHRAECKTYGDLVIYLLVLCHYLTLSKTDSEEIWSVRGELISIGTAIVSMVASSNGVCPKSSHNDTDGHGGTSFC